MKKIQLIHDIHESGVVAVLRGASPQEVVRMAEQAIAGGIRVIEVTLTVPYALEAITELSKRYHASGAQSEGGRVMIGAGTVLDPETARASILAGAEFVVAPCFKEETITLCNRYRVPVMPGVMTIGEIQKALDLGVDVMKLFPGNHYSPSFISTVHGPLPQANLMPTGGVTLANMAEWVKAGAFAVGIGSDLTKEAERTGDYRLVAEKAQAYTQAFAEAKAQG